jgi:predicted metal-binding protein
LGDAINSVRDKLKNYVSNDRILFADVNDHAGEVVVLPAILCKELKPNGKIRAKRRKGATPSPKTVSDEDKENKPPTTNELFYIHSNSSGITKIPNTAYEGKPLCVVAQANDTLKDAMLKDGRFCDEFILLQDDERQSDVPLQYLVSDYSRETFIMKKRAGKRRKEDKPGTGEDSSETASINPSKERVYSAMPISVTACFTEEIGKSMIEDARNSALKKLIQPGVGKDDLDKHIQSIAQKFGKVASSAIPARTLQVLAEATKSVGFITCGDCTGTCFFLFESTIITCQHVINKINTKRSQSTDKELYKTISVYFNFDRPLKLGISDAEIDETLIFTGEGNLDYAICGLKWIAPRSLTGLGPFVRSVLPRSGLVVLIGHPDNQFKCAETCHILPCYNWHSTLGRRYSEAEQKCKKNPEECYISDNEEESCVHIYKGRVLQGDHLNQLPYDTSFFHGSSGSPVFNSDGHIIALHTQGYPFRQGSKKVSLMEFGVTFGAICQDVRERYGLDKANLLFPEINS